jgi:hypothetical protein
MDTYLHRLSLARRAYPFSTWQKSGLEQYSSENCDDAQAIFDDLITELDELGENASEKAKLKKFEKAVVALNELNDRTEGALIETEEREQLCELVNEIAVQAQLDPTQYGDGEGPASEWRDW